MKDTDAIHLADDLVVVIEEDRLVVGSGEDSVPIQPCEVRQLVYVLVEGARKLVGGQTRE